MYVCIYVLPIQVDALESDLDDSRRLVDKLKGKYRDTKHELSVAVERGQSMEQEISLMHSHVQLLEVGGWDGWPPIIGSSSSSGSSSDNQREYRFGVGLWSPLGTLL